MTLAIFNPEHDLCLGNGRAHYLPPQSAVEFARRGASIMQILYPDATCTSLYDLTNLDSQFPSFRKASAALTSSRCQAKETSTKLTLDSIIPWGWNLVLKQDLLDRGVPDFLLPSDGQLDIWRQLQHRATILPLQPDCKAIYTLSDLTDILNTHNAIVLKAPWSGAGRGLRWITGSLTPHDTAWVEKIIREQNNDRPGAGCVVAQPRYEVAYDFALEYLLRGKELHFVGYSLFKTAKGVYRGNILLPDEAIRRHVGLAPCMKEQIEDWIKETLLGQYEGPLGIDLFRTVDGDIHVSEHNMRHTMGLVAHAFLRLHPEAEGSLFNPMELVR